MGYVIDRQPNQVARAKFAVDGQVEQREVALPIRADYAWHLKQLDPFIGALGLEQVHLGTLQPFIEMRQAAGVKHKSINLALSIVRRILNLSARLRRDEAGSPGSKHRR